uniref:Uncharacterized protein n=1 Tax=Siphoviridae sp. ctvGX2 TaxID=2826512 RepID=A0A8S5LZ98_9CAUD|nr:MAG TPA: hypothetical protein [Siphoviridae sp. ctvGX2]
MSYPSTLTSQRSRRRYLHTSSSRERERCERIRMHT